MVKIFFVLSFSLLLFSAGLEAQSIKPTDVVSINPVTNINGTEISIDFILNIKDTWHINANKPVDQSLTPTVIKIDSSSFYAVRNIIYPPAQMIRLQFSDSELALYEQEAIINVKVVIGKRSNKKTFKIKGNLQYQPCNDQTCLFPVIKPFNVVIIL